jgi:hypothetical protein
VRNGGNSSDDERGAGHEDGSKSCLIFVSLFRLIHDAIYHHFCFDHESFESAITIKICSR